MSSVKYAPRMMMGNYFYTTQRIADSGSKISIVIEQYYTGIEGVIGINTQDIGKSIFMWIVDGRTNHRLYASTTAAIKAACRQH